VGFVDKSVQQKDKQQQNFIPEKTFQGLPQVDGTSPPGNPGF
jgi:hypothetical protein